MKTAMLLNVWRKSLGPVRTPRTRRSPSLDSYLLPTTPADAHADDNSLDLSWHESSRALAHGLRVTEHAVDVAAFMRLAR